MVTNVSGLALAIALLHGATAPAAWAQQNAAATSQPIELDPVIVQATNGPSGERSVVAKRNKSASKTDTPLIETPQAVSVVTRGQMDAQGANTVAEALRYTPGVMSDPNGNDIRYDWLYIRGFNTYATTWLDGLVLPGDPSGYANPAINPYTLDRVEVIKGPASVLYGRTVPGGFVNQVSKRPLSTARREVSLQSSAFGGIQGAFDFTGPLSEDGAWSYRLIGLGKNLNTQIDHERDRQLLIAPSLSWRPDEKTTLTLYGYYQNDRPIFNPRFYPAVGTLKRNPKGQIPRDLFLGEPDWGHFHRDYFHLGYEFEHRFDDTWTVRQNLRFARSDQSMKLVLVNPAFAWQPDGRTLNRVTAMSQDTLSAFTVDTQVEAKFATGRFDHTVLAGLDYVHGTSSTNFGNSGSIRPIDILDPVYGNGPFPLAPLQRSGMQKQDQVGIYVQDQIRYERWVATLGLRYDISQIHTTVRPPGKYRTYTTRDRQLSGRAGLTYLFDNGLAPYVSYSTSFLPLLGTSAYGQPFEALTAEQYEAGLKYEPPGGGGMVGASVFQLTTDNSLSSLGVAGSVQNGRQRVRGIELEGKYDFSPQFQVMASYAYSDSKILSSTNAVERGREMLRLPEHQASLWALYRPAFTPGLSLSAGMRATSSYQTDVTYYRDLRIPGRMLVDLGAEYDFGTLRKELQGTTLRVNATNLFDRTYVSHCLNRTGGSCNYGAGRAITANLKYTW
ncbi:TonB-dependent receptor [Labrys sp. WJW]|uniref:TonB-dependent siderophore receptor n=1 Tax=Labrys sp. WJW TaxID=1737983 RepID=UPI00083433CA|nr:TonB-dependent siderophore receptor [Labrys sp. WJW]OCC05504.1 TonB-dependent receptor [Labrys sp. WJW]